MKLLWAVLLSVAAVSAQASDCSLSKEFRIDKAQAVTGVLEDPQGAALGGFELRLLSGKKTIRHLKTTVEGKYDFGEIPAGHYRIQVRHGDNLFCMPKVICSQERCTLPRLTLNPKSMVEVY